MARDSILLYNRRTQTVEEEKIFERWFMDFFYGRPLGLKLSEALIKIKWFSKLYGHLKRSPKSKESIPQFIEQYHINVEEIEDPLESFQTFNEFFIRKLKPNARPIALGENVLISPADSRVLVYPIKKDSIYPVKGKSFTLGELLGNDLLTASYMNGTCFIFRLAPADYHRFFYIDHGVQSPVTPIEGYLHSVNPLSLKNRLPVFTENYREYCILKTQHFGEVAQIDVGALVVGRIIQHQSEGGNFKKGDEKGYFEFGGSTIILLFQKGLLKIDDDIQKYSEQDIETIVQYGEKIALRINAPS